MNDLFADDYQQIHLGGPIDLAGFRRAARHLLANGIAPEQVAWHSKGAPTDLSAATFEGAPAIHVAPHFLALCETVILHSDSARFELLYRLLWRMAHKPDLRHDVLDADMLQARHFASAVHRDMHKMKAFVRFRTVADETFKARPTEGPMHVAWFEPEHHIVEAIAPFFARRFTQMRWAILTPERCMAWNGAALHFSPGAKKSDAPPPDAGEALWLTYYQHIFNPARFKLKMMQKEMPRRYWQNLPEAQLISGMTADAHERRVSMIERAPTTPNRRISAFRAGAGREVNALFI